MSEKVFVAPFSHTPINNKASSASVEPRAEARTEARTAYGPAEMKKKVTAIVAR